MFSIHKMLFSFKKISNRQNDSSSGSSAPRKKIPLAVFTTFWQKVMETPTILDGKEQ